MILHTVNKNNDCLQRCLALASGSDAILLIEDGVYAAFASPANETLWQNTPPGLGLFALDNDLAARGVSDKMLPRFNPINWQQFVALTCHYDKVVSWA